MNSRPSSGFQLSTLNSQQLPSYNRQNRCVGRPSRSQRKLESNGQHAHSPLTTVVQRRSGPRRSGSGRCRVARRRGTRAASTLAIARVAKNSTPRREHARPSRRPRARPTRIRRNASLNPTDASDRARRRQLTPAPPLDSRLSNRNAEQAHEFQPVSRDAEPSRARRSGARDRNTRPNQCARSPKSPTTTTRRHPFFPPIANPPLAV